MVIFHSDVSFYQRVLDFQPRSAKLYLKKRFGGVPFLDRGLDPPKTPPGWQVDDDDQVLSDDVWSLSTFVA